MNIKAFFDPRTSTMTYIVWEPDNKDTIIIDSILDYEPIGSKVWTESIDTVSQFIKHNQLNLCYILETHAHADHLSGSQLLKERFPEAKVAIGSRIVSVQNTFKKIFSFPSQFATDGSQFDKLIEDHELFKAGSISITSLPTPGHTPACSSFLIGDALFTGDALFMPDMGTGRCDFPAGSPNNLYKSIQDVIYTLPDSTRIFVGHDYQPHGRPLKYESTVGEQKAHNIQLRKDTTLEDFVSFRTRRDASLSAPKLLYQSVQVNIDGGHLPHEERTGSRLFQIPINTAKSS